MKTLIHAFLALIFISTNLQAQEPRSSKEERIKAVKVAFITEELELTSREAQDFWPLYNEMEAKMKTLKIRKKKVDFATLSDTEIEAKIEENFKKEEQRVAIKREYLTKFKKVIPMQKIAKLLGMERKFKRELLQRMKEHRRNGGEGGRSGGRPGGRRG